MPRPSCRLSTCLCLGVLVLCGVDCGPPPMALEDLPPCAMLRRKVCGEHDECADPGHKPSECESCKAELCAYVKGLEDDGQQLTCLMEYRARPEYPLCTAPEPLPTIPPPPFIYPVLCESECSLVPYPPKPPFLD